MATSKPDDDPLVCPLCAGNMMLSYNGREAPDPHDGGRRRRPLAVQRSCCQQQVCQSCLYRHVHSILEEGIAGGGAGRMALTCPLGCGREILDADVRLCFHRENANEFWDFFGPCILYRLCLLFLVLFPCFGGTNDNNDDFSVRRNAYWQYCRSTRAERNDLRQYERWSLAIALRSIQRQHGVPTMRCPSPNCDYAWLVASPAYRESKVAHERKKVYLWYAPPKPEESTSSGNGDDFDDWCRPEFLNMSRAVNTNTPGPGVLDWLFAENNAGDSSSIMWDSHNTKDGRYMCCAKCHVLFCGLCRQPWRFGSKCHAGISCRAYRRQLPAALQDDGENGNNAYAFMGGANSNGNNARCCPGCSMYTTRAGGCNHMTCPCGVEWCYVCEKPWNSPWHYGCVDRPTSNGATAGCVIS